MLRSVANINYSWDQFSRLERISECKYVNGSIKDNIASHKSNNYNQKTNKDSNNLSTTSINNCKTSENNAIRTTETPNNNDVINDNLASQLDIPVSTKTVSSKWSRVQFDVIIDKTSKQESPSSSKTRSAL